MTVEGDPKPGELALYHEQVLVDIGEQHLSKMDTIVDPLVVTDLATVVWSPHGHEEAVDSLLRLAQVVLIDSEGEPDPAAGGAARARARGARLRGGPRVAALHAVARAGGGQLRPAAVASRARGRSASVTARHRPDSVDLRGAVLRLARVAARLGAGLDDGPERHACRARHGRAARTWR